MRWLLAAGKAAIWFKGCDACSGGFSVRNIHQTRRRDGRKIKVALTLIVLIPEEGEENAQDGKQKPDAKILAVHEYSKLGEGELGDVVVYDDHHETEMEESSVRILGRRQALILCQAAIAHPRAACDRTVTLHIDGFASFGNGLTGSVKALSCAIFVERGLGGAPGVGHLLGLSNG